MPFKKKGARAKGKATKDQGKPSKDGDTSPASTSRSSFEDDFVMTDLKMSAMLTLTNKYNHSDCSGRIRNDD